MTSADKWCGGWVPQPPHVPNDGALIECQGGRFRLCRNCWRRWNADDGGGRRAS